MNIDPKTKRKLIVEQNFQLRYAFLFALTCFFLGLMATLAIVMFSHSYYGQLEKAGAFLTPSLARIYEQGWEKLCILLGFFTLLYSSVAFFVGLVLTRNIIGPVIAFRTSIDRLLETRKPEKFDLRSKDELKVLKDVYARIAEKIK